MSKLIRFEFRKLLKSTSLYVILGISLALVLISALTYNLAVEIAKASGMPVDPITGYTFTKTTITGTFMLLIGIFIALYAAGDYSHGILKNVFAKGYNRIQVFFSKYIVSLIATICIALITVLFAYVIGKGFYGGSRPDGENIAVVIIGQLLAVITYHALYFALAYTIGRSGIAIAINCVAPTVVSLLLTLGDTALQKSNVSFKLADYWIDGALGIFNTSAVSDSSKFAQGIILLVVYFGIALAAGILLNRRKEVKN